MKTLAFGALMLVAGAAGWNYLGPEISTQANNTRVEAEKTVEENISDAEKEIEAFEKCLKELGK